MYPRPAYLGKNASLPADVSKVSSKTMRLQATCRLDRMERVLVRARPGRDDRLSERVHVPVADLNGDHLPGVGLVALGHALREVVLDVAARGEAVAVPESEQLPCRSARRRPRLVKAALLKNRNP